MFLLNILNSGKLSVEVEIDFNFWRGISVENDMAVMSPRLLLERGIKHEKYNLKVKYLGRNLKFTL